MSKYQKLKNSRKKSRAKLQEKILKFKARAKVDYLIMEKLRMKYPQIHIEIYKELDAEGIKHRGIIRKESKRKEVI
jgi:hypothetical protein